MNFDNLKKMSRDQLKELAGKQGLSVHPRAKDETIIKQIMENTFSPPQPQQAAQHPAQERQLPVHDNTPDQVEEAISHIKKRLPEFVSTYDMDKNTWHFRFRGAEECGNLAIPLRVIKMKADNVSRGALKLMGMQGFEQISNKPNSLYTGTVLTA